jgi:hypothetical protein
MRGIPEYNFPAFRAATKTLREHGWEVFSPAERDEKDPLIDVTTDIAGWDLPDAGLDYFMSYDLKAVCDTECVILLPGWQVSQGARLEAMVAVEIGHPVFEMMEEAEAFSTWDYHLSTVTPERVLAEFTAGSIGWDGLPTATPAPVPAPAQATSAWGFPESEEPPAKPGVIRLFETGATRNVEVDPDIHGSTSPLALQMFGRYMQEHRLQADGTMRDADNWKKGITRDSYMRSMRRHLHDLELHYSGYGDLARDDLYAALSGLFFNVQGFMHEQMKADIETEREQEAAAPRSEIRSDGLTLRNDSVVYGFDV